MYCNFQAKGDVTLNYDEEPSAAEFLYISCIYLHVRKASQGLQNC